jgi:hypothetical protein
VTKKKRRSLRIFSAHITTNAIEIKFSAPLESLTYVQVEKVFSISRSKASFHLSPRSLVCAQLLRIISIDCCILRRSPQALARQSYVVSGAEVSVIGIDIDAVGA